MKHICTHHIGGRAGNRAFPVLDSFEKDFVNVLYDADRDCIAQIEARNKKLQSELIVLPYFFGEKNKEKTVFNITYDPYASSHREYNKEYDSWYFYFRREEYDYILSEATKTVEKRVQKMVTLDGLLTKNTSPPPPDILSIDVQGMEYEVLQGAKKVLKSNVLAIITEIEFLPLYKGQKLFGDIFSLLRDKGFHFVKFLKIAEFSPYRAAIGLRGEGFQSWGDALFFRKIEDIKNIKDLSIQQEMLDKLAFISIVFHQFEYALECIKQSKECRKLIGLDKDDEKKYSYIKMLREIEIEVENLKKRFPPTFADKYSFEESKARFEIYSVYGKNEQQSVGPKSKDIKEYDDSNIEKILRNYGLEQQVDIIKKLRIQQDTGLDLPDKGEMRAKQ